jgi:hypothetical protein
VGRVEASHKMNSNLYDIFVEKHEGMNSENKERGRKERKRLEI